MRIGFGLLAVVAAVVLLSGCERSDKSYATSPTAKTLLGTTTGNTAFNEPEIAPEPKAPPEGWFVEFGLARWTELENGSPALEIVMQIGTQSGAGMELWITHERETVARWWGGSTTKMTGTVCFQLELERDGEAVPLREGTHQATLAFREPNGELIAADRLDVTHRVPELEGGVPERGSEVFREAFACKRGS